MLKIMEKSHLGNVDTPHKGLKIVSFCFLYQNNKLYFTKNLYGN